MRYFTELKRAAEAVMGMSYPWEHTVRDGRMGKTSTEYALLAHPSNVLALIDDNERLKATVYAVHGAGVAELHEQISQLKAENEKLRKDAERYRGIRAATLKQLDETPDQFDAEFDRQIGAAMSQKE